MTGDDALAGREDEVLAAATETQDAFYAAAEKFVDNETASRDPQRPLSSTGETQPDTGTEAVETSHNLPGIPQKRSAEFMQAWRAATKYAVTWMHGHAEAMNDPHARAIMNAAAFDFGQQMKRAWQGDETLPADLLVSSVDLTIKARFMERDLAAAIARAEAAERDREALMAVARAARGLVTRDDFWRDEIFASVNNPIPGEYDSVIAVLDSLRPGLLEDQTKT